MMECIFERVFAQSDILRHENGMFCFSESLKPFHGTLVNLMEIYAPTHLEVFRKSKNETRAKIFDLWQCSYAIMINESSFFRIMDFYVLCNAAEIELSYMLDYHFKRWTFILVYVYKMCEFQDVYNVALNNT